MNFMINIIDTNKIRKDIERAKLISDYVIVYLHFGEEYQRKANFFQKELVNKIFNYGVEVIIASHPHVIQEIIFENGKLIAYSLGNFLSNQRWRYSDAGAILNFTIEKNDSNKIFIKDVYVKPTWVFKGKINNRIQFRILKADTTNFPIYLNNEDKIKIKQAYSDTKQQLKNIKIN